MYEHYITLDSEKRIIDGYTTAQHPPAESDIFLHSGGAVFELFGKDPYRELSLLTQNEPVWLYVYEEGKPRHRTKAELAADLPVTEPPRSVDERLSDAEADVQTLTEVLNIMLGGVG